MARMFVAGNWKMNGVLESLDEATAIADAFSEFGDTIDAAICPPATLLHALSIALNGTLLRTGGQDCHANPSGAHTGDISAQMLSDLGASYAIVGHSERRTDHGETNDIVQAKASAALKADLTAIICIGETEQQRKGGDTLSILTQQIEGSVPENVDGNRIVIAYEPVWAIGTGLVPSLQDIADAHAHIRAELSRIGVANHQDVPIQYGGSVKATNAQDILQIDNVDGALVGGASLKAADFVPILEAAAANH